MFRDKRMRRLLFGKGDEFSGDLDSRSATFRVPAAGEDEVSRTIKWRNDDGLIVYLIKRIEALEKKVNVSDFAQLEIKTSTKK